MGYLSSSWLALVVLVGTWTHCHPLHLTPLPALPPLIYSTGDLSEVWKNLLKIQQIQLAINFLLLYWKPMNSCNTWTATINHREGRMDWIIKIIISWDITLCTFLKSSHVLYVLFWNPVTYLKHFTLTSHSIANSELYTKHSNITHTNFAVNLHCMQSHWFKLCAIQ